MQLSFLFQWTKFNAHSGADSFGRKRARCQDISEPLPSADGLSSFTVYFQEIRDGKRNRVPPATTATSKVNKMA